MFFVTLQFITTHDFHAVIRSLFYALKAVGVPPLVLEGEIGNWRLRISGPAVIYLQCFSIIDITGASDFLDSRNYIFSFETFQNSCRHCNPCLRHIYIWIRSCIFT